MISRRVMSSTSSSVMRCGSVLARPGRKTTRCPLGTGPCACSHKCRPRNRQRRCGGPGLSLYLTSGTPSLMRMLPTGTHVCGLLPGLNCVARVLGWWPVLPGTPLFHGSCPAPQR